MIFRILYLQCQNQQYIVTERGFAEKRWDDIVVDLYIKLFNFILCVKNLRREFAVLYKMSIEK